MKFNLEVFVCHLSIHVQAYNFNDIAATWRIKNCCIYDTVFMEILKLRIENYVF